MSMPEVSDAMVLTEYRERTRRVLQASLNLPLFASRRGWSKEEEAMVVSMLGLEEMTAWVNEQRQL